MNILLTGSSGMIGSALTEALVASGHNVVSLVRASSSDGQPFWDPENGVVDMGDVTGIDAVVHLAASSITDSRWNARTKTRILESRVNGTELISSFFAMSDDKPGVIISASGVGAYGDCGDERVREDRPFGSSFLADVARRWEDATSPATEAGIRVVNMRLGLVLSTSGGALQKMHRPFQLCLGGAIGSGTQYMSWIHIDDVMHVIQYIMASEAIRGPVNVVSPAPVTNKEFTRTLAQVLHRPAIFRIPACIASLAFGDMADELLLSSTRAIPGTLMHAGYTFRHAGLEDALRHLLRG